MKRNRVVAIGATIGFLVGVALGVFAFTPEGTSGNYVALFLLFCPPSVGAMHDQSLLWAIITWAVICFMNAGLYALVFAAVHYIALKVSKPENI